LAHFYNCVYLLIYKNKELSYLTTISIVFFVSQYKVGRFGGLFLYYETYPGTIW